MSTTLKNQKNLATLVKTITHFYDESFGSEDLRLRALGNNLHDFLMDSDTALGGGVGAFGKELLEKKLFEHLASNNLKSFIADYPEDQNEPGFMDDHKKETLKIRSNFEKLDKLALPLNGRNVNRLQAMIVDTLHGFNDIDESPIPKALNKLSQQLAKHSIVLHSDYPETLPEKTDVIQAFLSAHLYGDQYLGLQNGFRSVVDRLEAYGTYPSGSNRTFYATDVMADLVNQFLEREDPVRFCAHGSKTSRTLPTFTGLSGLNVRIQSDIPNQDRKAIFVVAKTLNDMNERFMALPDFSLLKEGGSSRKNESESAWEFRQNFAALTRQFNNQVSSELEGFQSHWSRTPSVEESHEPS